MALKYKIWLALQSLVCAVAILWMAGLLSEEGKFYSTNPHYRQQVNALMQGELALSRDPALAVHDLTWSEGGVHQVWGLGVPLWRLPWEGLARLAGVEGFPDLLAIALALFLTIWLFLGAWFSSLVDLNEPFNLGRLMGAAGAAMLFLAQPTFLGLLATRFDIYEEAVAYALLYDLVILACLVRLARAPEWKRFWLVCGVAGLGGLVRPTVVFYGVAAVVAGLAVMIWEQRSMNSWPGRSNTENNPESGNLLMPWKLMLRPVTVGVLLFAAGGGVLYWTNLARFGSGFEFGHRLNLQHLYGSMYATRFDHPYQREPFWSATREMLGLLFQTREMSGGDFYKRNFFPGQSPTTRWREVYLTAYDWTYLPLLLGGALAGGLALCRWWRERRETAGRDAAAATPDREIAALALWGAMAAVALFGFYLRNSVISSRYLLDFMPGFAALMAAGWLGWCRWWGKHPAARYVTLLSLALLCGWLVWGTSRLRSAYGPPRLLTWAEVQQRMDQQKARAAQPRPALPSHYDAATRFDAYQIPYNGAGWTPETGAVRSLIILFIEDPQYLELTVRGEGSDWEHHPPDHVRAKIGLEFLERESVKKSEDGWVVRFRRPRAHRYQHGLQVAFIVFVPNTQLADVVTPWRLLKAQWKDDFASKNGGITDGRAAAARVH